MSEQNRGGIPTTRLHTAPYAPLQIQVAMRDFAPLVGVQVTNVTLPPWTLLCGSKTLVAHLVNIAVRR